MVYASQCMQIHTHTHTRSHQRIPLDQIRVYGGHNYAQRVHSDSRSFTVSTRQSHKTRRLRIANCSQITASSLLNCIEIERDRARARLFGFAARRLAQTIGSMGLAQINRLNATHTHFCVRENPFAIENGGGVKGLIIHNPIIPHS